MVKLALTIIAVLHVVTADAVQATTSSAHLINCTMIEPKPCPSCPNPTTCPTATQPPPPLPVLATVYARTTDAGSCQGDVHLVLGVAAKKPLCFDSRGKLPFLTATLCNHLGCGTFLRWKSSRTSMGHRVLDDGRLHNCTCATLGIECKARPDSRELVGYKVVTGLLSSLFIVFIFIRFGPARCNSVRNKLFKQKNREWIGPTQSQSVSIYRAQAGAQANSNAKRLSYPALERLSVFPSREPSSNRNSDCDSYN